MLKIIDVKQGDPAWFQYRTGRATGSAISQIVSKTKSGSSSASRQNYLSQLVLERLNNKPVQTFQTDAMRIGSEREPEARAAYALINGDVEEIGIIQHPTLEWACASPDGLLLNRTAAIEIKSPQPAAHLETLMSDDVPSRYIPQIQWLMACGPTIQYVDYVSYNPDFNDANLQLYTKRVLRDDAYIKDLNKQVSKFLDEVEETVTALRNKYSLRDAA